MSESIKSPKTDSCVGLTQLKNMRWANRRSSILTICPSQFHRRSLARIRTYTAGILASSLPLICDGVWERVKFIFPAHFLGCLPRFVVVQESWNHRGTKRRRHVLIGSCASAVLLDPESGTRHLWLQGIWSAMCSTSLVLQVFPIAFSASWTFLSERLPTQESEESYDNCWGADPSAGKSKIYVN